MFLLSINPWIWLIADFLLQTLQGTYSNLQKLFLYSFAGIETAKDPGSAVNTQSNAVRCVGNMLLYLHSDRLGSQAEFDNIMRDGVDAIVHLIHTGKIMKIRWNACYAAGNVLKKKDIERNSSWKKT